MVLTLLPKLRAEPAPAAIAAVCEKRYMHCNMTMQENYCIATNFRGCEGGGDILLNSNDKIFS
jgi:hypothetical protein